MAWSLEFIEFIILAGLAIASALLTLEAREIIYGLFYFGVFTIAVGGLYILLNAGYLAMFQMAIYAGAVVVLVFFAIMLVRRKEGVPLCSSPTIKSKLGSALLSILFIIFLLYFVMQYPWATAVTLPVVNPGDIFYVLIHNQLLSFELIAVLSATTIIGGVALVREDEEIEEGH